MCTFFAQTRSGGGAAAGAARRRAAPQPAKFCRANTSESPSQSKLLRQDPHPNEHPYIQSTVTKPPDNLAAGEGPSNQAKAQPPLHESRAACESHELFVAETTCK